MGQKILYVALLSVALSACGGAKSGADKKSEASAEKCTASTAECTASANFNKETSMKVSVWAKITAAEGKESELREGLSSIMIPTHKEKGCEAYDLYEDSENSGVFFFHEVWSSAADLENHLGSQHLKEFKELRTSKGLVAGNTVLSKWERNDTPMPKITDSKALVLFAKITAKSGKESELERELEALIAPTRAEKGCIHYDLHRSSEDKGVFLFHETWSTVPAWDDHMKNDHLVSFLAKLDSLVEGDIEMHKTAIVVPHKK